jgi:hypothetical protein
VIETCWTLTTRGALAETAFAYLCAGASVTEAAAVEGAASEGAAVEVAAPEGTAAEDSVGKDLEADSKLTLP